MPVKHKEKRLFDKIYNNSGKVWLSLTGFKLFLLLHHSAAHQSKVDNPLFSYSRPSEENLPSFLLENNIFKVIFVSWMISNNILEGYSGKMTHLGGHWGTDNKTKEGFNSVSLLHDFLDLPL